MTWLRRVHAWLGLAISLLLATMALSGAALVFKSDLRRISLHLPPLTERSPEQLAHSLEAAGAAFGPGGFSAVLFASPEINLDEVFLTDNGGAYLDPSSGRVVARWGPRERLGDILYDAHHRLFLGEAGEQLTGWIGILAAGMAVSGLVLWWPARRAFAANWRPMRPGRAGLLAAHRDLGLMTAPMLIWVALSGSAMALDDLSRAAFGFSLPKAPHAEQHAPVDWPRALAAAQARFPDAAIRYAIPPRRPGAPVLVRLQQPGEWHANGRTQVYLEPDGRVLAVHDALAASRGERLFNLLWPLHAVKVGGLPWKAVVFLTGLSLASLALYGAEAYRRRLFPGPRRNPAPSRPGAAKPAPRRSDRPG